MDPLKVSSAPAALAETAQKHNWLVDLIKSITGAGGITVTTSENNIVVDGAGATAAAIAGAPVQSVNGQTGAVSLAVGVSSVAGRTGDVTLSTSDISGFTADAAAAAPVQSVAGRTGTVTLSTSDISGFTAAAAAAAPVQSVAGRTGNVTLSLSDIATSGSNILAANGSGGFANVTIGNGIAFATSTLSANIGGNLVFTSTAIDVPQNVAATAFPTFAGVIIQSNAYACNIAGTAISHAMAIREIDVCDAGVAKKMLIIASAPY